MYLYYILNNFPLKKVNPNKLIFLIFLIFLISENYMSYNEFMIIFNEFYLNLVNKLLNIISSMDVNLVLMLVLMLVLNWFYFKSGGIFMKLIIVSIFFEKEMFSCFFAGTSMFMPMNTNLLNGLFFFHPLMLIMLMTVFYMNLSFNFKFSLNLNLKLKKLYTYKQSMNNLLLMLSMLLLFTGGWWAQQELNWGGWWAWDFVEQTNLNVFLLLLGLRHSTFFKKNNYNYNCLYFFICMIMYMYTSYNLMPSIHSFLSELSFLQYDYMIDIFLMFLMFSFLKKTFLKNIVNIEFKFFKKLYFMTYSFKMMNMLLMLLMFSNIFYKNVNLFNMKLFQHMSVVTIIMYFTMGYSFNFLNECCSYLPKELNLMMKHYFNSIVF